MGHIHQRVRLRGAKTATVDMLVDTGATYCVIPKTLATRLGIKRPRRMVRVALADGRKLRLGADVAIVEVDGRSAPATILVGRVDEPILGVEALEALGLAVDPRKKRLSPSRGYAVRLGGYR
jgi:clan AA aspartic protease